MQSGRYFSGGQGLHIRGRLCYGSCRRGRYTGADELLGPYRISGEYGHRDEKGRDLEICFFHVVDYFPLALNLPEVGFYLVLDLSLQHLSDRNSSNL